MPFKISETNMSLVIDHRPNKSAEEKIRSLTGKILDLIAEELPKDRDIKYVRLRFESEQDITQQYMKN